MLVAAKPQEPGGTLPHVAGEAKRTVKTPRKKCIRTGLPLAFGKPQRNSVK